MMRFSFIVIVFEGIERCQGLCEGGIVAVAQPWKKADLFVRSVLWRRDGEVLDRALECAAIQSLSRPSGSSKPWSTRWPIWMGIAFSLDQTVRRQVTVMAVHLSPSLWVHSSSALAWPIRGRPATTNQT